MGWKVSSNDGIWQLSFGNRQAVMSETDAIDTFFQV